MTTINEDYVSYEVAKLLKEKGFNELCFRLIRHDGEIVEAPSQAWNGMSKKQKAEFYLYPTHQMAMKWLREKHHIVIGINIGNENKKGNTDYSNPDRWWYFWEWTNDRGVYKEELQPNALDNEYPTYESACEAALKYSLENLI